MKKSQRSLFIVFAFGMLITFNSCYYPGYVDPYVVDVTRQKENYYYAPAAPTVPLLVKKNDFSITMNGSTGKDAKGGSVHGAFKPTKNLGLMSSYSWFKNDVGSNDIGRFVNYEFGAGYVGSLSPYWHFETYGGIGSGKVENEHHTGYSKIKTNSFFLQPTIAVSDKKQLMQFGFFSKFSRTKFDLLDTSFNNDREQVVTNQMRIIHDNPSQLFWEPGFIGRVGWSVVQLNLSYTFSSDLTNKELFRKKGLFSIGVIVKLNANNLKTK
jgi:hypothetical protein